MTHDTHALAAQCCITVDKGYGCRYKNCFIFTRQNETSTHIVLGVRYYILRSIQFESQKYTIPAKTEQNQN